MKKPAKRKNPILSRQPAKRGGRAATATEILGQAPKDALSSMRVPAKWRLHYRVLISLQDRLLRDRGDLLRVAAEPLEPHSLDEADSATDEFDHDLALAQLSAEQDALYEVNEALNRILDGTYGVCEETGEATPASRLKAVPWTRFTWQIKDRLEKTGDAPRTRLNKAATVRGDGKLSFHPDDEEDEEAAEQKAPPTAAVSRRGNSPCHRKAGKRKQQR